MSYYLINTDSNAFGYSPHEKWFEYNHAFASGDYEKFGVKTLGELTPNDVLFMYVNDLGIAAAGIVLESWVGSSYKGRDRLVYTHNEELSEYRILVGWGLRTVDNPISVKEANEIIRIQYPKGIVYASAFQQITNRDAGANLLREIKNRASTYTEEIYDD